MTEPLAGLAFVLLMLAAVVSDIRSMTISNTLNLMLISAFAVSAVWNGMPVVAAAVHVATGLTLLVMTALLFHFNWMGGGDAKLIASTALWFGPSHVLLDYLLLASMFGGVLTLMLLSVRALRQPTTGVEFLDRLLARQGGIPYGVALGLAGIVAGVGSATVKLG